MVFSHQRDMECGGNAAALALFATDSSRGTSARSNRSAESQSAAADGALQMAFKMMHHLLVYKGVDIAPVPTSYFPEAFRLGPVPHTGQLPRAIKLHRQNTSLDQGVASWDGAMPRPTCEQDACGPNGSRAN